MRERTDPSLKFFLIVTDHVNRRYVLPLVLLAATVLRYNVFSLTYFLLFMIGVVVTGPRKLTNRVASIVYLATVLTLSVVYLLSQLFFQISLVTGPQLDYCETIEVILRQIGLIQFTVPFGDVLRHSFLDFVVAMVASVSVGVSIKVSRLHNGQYENGTSNEGLSDPVSDSADNQTITESSSHVLLPSINDQSSSTQPQTYLRLPSWSVLVVDVVLFFLFMAAGVSVPSIVSFWYFIVFLILGIMWSVHYKGARTVGRVIKTVSLIYTALHLIVLYLYQFQSFQLSVPLTSYDNTRDLIVRLFGLTPVVKTTCAYTTGLSFWKDTPTFYFVNPFVLVALYWTLGVDTQLWLTTPKSFWSLYDTYCVPTIPSFFDTLDYQTHSDVPAPRYGSISSTSLGGKGGDKITRQTESSVGNRPSIFNKIKRNVARLIVELMKRLMSISYVFSLVAMMVWSVLYPSWPGLVLLLWAVAIWVIPRINPKQSLQYSSPFLVIYAVCLLIVSFINALPITEEAFTWNFKVEITCKYSKDHIVDCLSVALGVKCLLSLVFFASLQQLIFNLKKKRRKQHQLQEDDQMLTADNEEEYSTSGSVTERLYNEIYSVLVSYWIVVVVGAFLLVILVGQPSALKTVYLVFLFIFFLFYQLFHKWWLVIVYPLWWFLVLYGTIHLVLVYTYQFDEINSLWYEGYMEYNETDYYSLEDVFSSVGFETSNNTTSTDLFNLLFPLAIFIAVIALQLRYFSPLRVPSQSGSAPAAKDPLTVAQVLTGLTPGDAFNEMELEIIEKDLVRKRQERRDRRSISTPGSIGEDLEHEDAGPAGDGATPIDRTTPSGTNSTLSYRILVYLLFNIRHIVSVLRKIFWRFFEIHIHKFVLLGIFAYGIYEPSVSYSLVMLCAILTCPLPVLNHVLYPLLTVYLGLLSVGKYVYQFPVVSSTEFEDVCTVNLSNSSTNITGQVFKYTFSPLNSDISWFGLNQTYTPLTQDYIGGVISIAVLMCFWYTVRRHQAHLHSINDIVVDSHELRSLFLGVDYGYIHDSLKITLQFFINHFFDLFGLEMCFVFEALVVAARVDVYGTVYAFILGLLIMLPRSLLSKAWPVVVVTHAVLLIIQYGLLVGLPITALCEYHGYPWDRVLSDSIIRWLYLPRAGATTLDKYLLYADFFAYMMVCFQARSFMFNPVKQLLSELPMSFGKVNWFKFIKVQILKNSFWVALFVLFISAASSGLSLLGLLFLVICFVFLYRGSEMLIDSRNTRKKWWSGLRLFVWLVLLTRNILQLIGCTAISSKQGDSYCFIVSLFDIRCVRDAYYGISGKLLCRNGTEGGMGLWLDLMAFAFITVEIVIMDSLYIELVRGMEVTSRRNAQRFCEIRQEFIDQRKKKAEEAAAEDIRKLHQREMQLRSRFGRVDMLLYAGVSVPPEYISQITPELITDSSEEEFPIGTDDDTHHHDDDTHHHDDSDKLSETTKEHISKETPQPYCDPSAIDSAQGFKKFLLILYCHWLEAVDVIIRWLEASSEDYTHALLKLKQNNSFEDILVDPISSTSDDEPIDSSNRMKRLFTSLYYCFLSHFDYFVFLIIIIAIVTVGTLTSLIYAVLLFFWGVLSPRTPSKWFWQTIMGYTMCVMLLKYIYTFGTFTLLSKVDTELNKATLASKTITSYTILSWVFGNERDRGYFRLSLVNLLLLIFIMIHRGLLKQQGLWRRSIIFESPRKNLLNALKGKVKQFLGPPPSDYRRDYYVPALICDILCFMTIIFGYSHFAVTTEGSDKGVLQAASYIQSNQIPIPFLLLLLFQFLSMLTDRAIYILRSRFAKLVLYIFLVVTWNIGLLVIIPALTQKPFYVNLAAQFIYFFKSLYFLFSGCQIVSGYPSKRLRYFVSSSYSSINGVIFMCYRFIPLLSELREVIDWMFTDSTLSFRQWLRVQEIWAEVYLVKVRRVREQTFFSREIGEKFNSVAKYLQGSGFVFALLLLIWGPLILMSLINQASIAHPPVVATISLSLEGSQLLKIEAESSAVYELNSEQYEHLRKSVTSYTVKEHFSTLFNIDNFRYILFPGNSSILWTATPTTKQQLRSVLRSKEMSSITFSWDLRRSEGTLADQAVLGSHTTQLKSETIELFIKNLDSMGSQSIPIFLKELYPVIVYAPNSGRSGEFHELSQYIPNNKFNCNASLSSSIAYTLPAPPTNNTNNTNLTGIATPTIIGEYSHIDDNIVAAADRTIISQWWTLKPAMNGSSFLKYGFQGHKNDLEMLVYSQRVSPAIFSYAASIGVVGLYVSVVLVIGKFIRSYVNELPHNIITNQMLVPDRLLDLLDDIFTVREMGDLVMEEILVGKLYSIYRSSGRFVAITDGRRFKPKSD